MADRESPGLAAAQPASGAREAWPARTAVAPRGLPGVLLQGAVPVGVRRRCVGAVLS